MPTITDVARLAEVSKATVSRYINKKGYVGAETREKIEYAIRQLNYRPNPIASSMISRKTQTIGLIVPDITNTFFTQLARAVEDIALSRSFTTILCNSDNDPGKTEHYINVLADKYVDGIIVTGAVTKGAEALLSNRGIHYVKLDTPSNDENIVSIYLDNECGGRIATDHLFEQGYSRIAHIHGPKDSFSAQKRYEGYCHSLAGHGAGLEHALVQWGDYQIDSGYRAMKSLLALADPPDAIFVANDMMVCGALEALAETPLAVPGDMGIVGFDDIPVLRAARPSVTTVRQPVYDMGVCAVQTLFAIIGGTLENKGDIIFKPALVVKKSSMGKRDRC